MGPSPVAEDAILATPPRSPSVTAASATPGTRSGRIVVRVRAPEGARLGELRVEVKDASGGRVAALAPTGASLSAGLDCEPGEYELALEHVGAQPLGALPRRIVIAAGTSETVEFSLATTWRLAGRLADERDLGLEAVPIALERAERAVGEVETRPDGTFQFPPLPEGDYALVVGDPLGPLLPRRILRLDGELGPQELRVPVLLELEVRVVDEQGFAVPGAEVEGVGEKGGRIAGQTDADGRVRAGLLPPGNYRVYARHESLGRGNRIVALAAAPAAPLEIRLLTGPPAR